MSLLMDALKKAEQAKQAAQPAQPGSEAPAAPPADLQLEPLHPPAGPPAALPELPSHMEAIEAELQAAASQAKAEEAKKAAAKAAATKPPVIRAEPTAAHQAQAQNLFDAKQATTVRKPFIIIVSICTLLAVAGIGVYFWLQLQPAGGLRALTPPPSGPLPRPAPLVAVAPPPAPLAAPLPLPPAAAKVRPTVEEEEPVGRPAPAPAQAAATPRAPQPASPIRITHGTVKLNPDLERGFEAYSRGDLTSAEAGYNQALKADPRNADALHGLAAVALRQGRPQEAEGYYQRAVEADPKDAVAQAGLAGLRGQGDPVAEESRLQTLIAGQPDQPHLQFALGNVYAAQKRWPEAQQAYFKAFSGDPENPDYLFNLAVSLDQLHQGKLAAQYYNQALAAASQRPAGFDKTQAATRLRELQP
ncbi:MAG TPA: tetratricopeptide repeat protein [Rhodocyclaceae bacterium]|nr:tetratricopeptide repeat protein [Rhodocyclaceae bacterium]